MSGEFISQEFACYRTDDLKISHTLDIHWKLNNSPVFADKLKFPELAAEAQPVPALSPYARALGPIHALLLAGMHRCAHAYEGQSNRLIWLYDIHLLACRFTPADWASYTDTANRLGLSSICLDGLLITQRRFSTAIPEHIVDNLRTAAASAWLTPALLASNAGNLYAGFRALPNWRSRMSLLREYLFPDARYMLEKYQTAQRWRLPLLYLHRICTRILKLIR